MHRAEIRDGPCGGGAYGGTVGDVERQCQCIDAELQKFLAGMFETVRREVGNGDVRATFGEGSGEAKADTAGAARDEYDPVFETIVVDAVDGLLRCACCPKPGATAQT